MLTITLPKIRLGHLSQLFIFVLGVVLALLAQKVGQTFYILGMMLMTLYGVVIFGGGVSGAIIDPGSRASILLERDKYKENISPSEQDVREMLGRAISYAFFFHGALAGVVVYSLLFYGTHSTFTFLFGLLCLFAVIGKVLILLDIADNRLWLLRAPVQITLTERITTILAGPLIAGYPIFCAFPFFTTWRGF